MGKQNRQGRRRIKQEATPNGCRSASYSGAVAPMARVVPSAEVVSSQYARTVKQGAVPDLASSVSSAVMPQLAQAPKTVLSNQEATPYGCMSSAAVVKPTAVVTPEKKTVARKNRDSRKVKRNKTQDPRDNQVMGFGKYRHLTFKQVKKNHPDYCKWAKKQTACPTGQLKAFMEYLGVKRSRISADPGQKRLSFGKHKGMKYNDVLQTDLSYCSWARSQTHATGGLADFGYWLRQSVDPDLFQSSFEDYQNHPWEDDSYDDGAPCVFLF